MTASAGAAPPISQIRSAGHLESAASLWERTAEVWEHAFTALDREAVHPGGTSWEGAGAEAARTRTGADRVAALGAADYLYAAARAARAGADEVAVARQSALRVIDSIGAAGFTVSEDLSIVLRQLGGTPAEQMARLKQVQVLAALLRKSGENLVAVDTEVASRITAAMTGVSGIRFSVMPVAPRRKQPEIQAVDYSPRPQTPIPDPGVPGDAAGNGVGPTGAEIRSVIDGLPRGDKPWIREVRSPQDLQNLWKWMNQSGSAITNPYGDSSKGVEVSLPDGTRVGQRFAADSTGKPVLDTNVPGEGYVKVHINDSRGGIPEIPPSTPRPAVEAPPRAAPVEPPAMRGGMPGGIVGGVLPDNVLPYFIEPPGTKDLPVIGDGKPDGPQA